MPTTHKLVSRKGPKSVWDIQVYRNLTDAEERVIIHYAALHGRAWRRRLLDDWTRASYPLASDDSAILQSMRNSLGPEWLIWFKLPD